MMKEVTLPSTEQNNMRERRNSNRERLDRNLQKHDRPPPAEKGIAGKLSYEDNGARPFERI